MPTPNFSTSQSAGDLSTLTITDTSTSLVGGLTGRLITIVKYGRTYLTPKDYTTDYVFWPIASSSLDIENILDKDYCVDITVRWFTGSTATYTKTILSLFTGYSDIFLRRLTQALASDKTTITAPNYWQNKIKLRTLLDDANQAVTLLNDQTIASFCLAEAKKLTDNISMFFS